MPPYVKNINPEYSQLSGYNPSGGGYPDVSAIGANSPVVNYGQVSPNGAGGTSFSAPIVAAMIALLNDHEDSKGRPPLVVLWKGERDV